MIQTEVRNLEDEESKTGAWKLWAQPKRKITWIDLSAYFLHSLCGVC